jgi:hypothetical protein
MGDGGSSHLGLAGSLHLGPIIDTVSFQELSRKRNNNLPAMWQAPKLNGKDPPCHSEIPANTTLPTDHKMALY